MRVWPGRLIAIFALFFLWSGALRAEPFAGTYAPSATNIAPGVWLVRGADEPIRFSNGGAIANSVILDSAQGAILVDCGPSLAYGRALGALARKVTGKAVARVFVTHLHPDHMMGCGAFDRRIVAALPETIHGIEENGSGYSDAMFRILAGWMKGTEVEVPGIVLSPGDVSFGGRRITAWRFSGHSRSDLVLLDEETGTLIAGDMVFHDRAPATPDADLSLWERNLDALAKIPHKRIVPGHGPLDTGEEGVDQTRAWLVWLDGSLHKAVADGLDMTEAGQIPIPASLSAMAFGRYELQRSVSHFYPRLEDQRFPRIGGG
ncbi:quinoprotein relay system zinc metallohydrolase 1 [Novosphingobium sp. ZN18A2]|uniref:quinoprotein relay system zinc metallohydrolase 1 n=1 Tax=Novosphingobium sp. ZN18A2 TaxID=3079861 RepID=UPI0030CB51B3